MTKRDELQPILIIKIIDDDELVRDALDDLFPTLWVFVDLPGENLYSCTVFLTNRLGKSCSGAVACGAEINDLWGQG